MNPTPQKNAAEDAKSNVAPPWYSAYPVVRNVAPLVTRSELLGWIDGEETPRKNIVLVDLRRADHEGGTIRGSINLPAQSIYSTLPTLYNLFCAAGVESVIFYCGSSRGRGNRAAGWFNDYLSDRGDTTMKSLVLEEGINGWAHGGERYVQLMDDYKEVVWQK